MHSFCQRYCFSWFFIMHLYYYAMMARRLQDVSNSSLRNGKKRCISTNINLKVSKACVSHACDLPSWICPRETGRCCALLGRPLARFDSARPSSLSHAHRSCHPRPRRQRKGEGEGPEVRVNIIT